jgi:signal transduction histidine kinase
MRDAVAAVKAVRATVAVPVIAAAEALVVATWLTSSAASVVAIVQGVVLMLMALGALCARYLVLRARLHEDIAWEAGTAERSRIAEEMHDALGHELSLIAVKAGALQVTHPDVAERTESIRRGAERAIAALRDIIAVLPAHAADVAVVPASVPLSGLITAARCAGLNVHAELDDLEDLPAIVLDTVHRVIREGLTNAGRYAPTRSVTLQVRRTEDIVAIRLTNPTKGQLPTTARAGTGLTTLSDRLGVLGGSLEVHLVDRVFQLSAELPCRPRLLPVTRVLRPTLPRRQVLLSLGLPAVGLLAAVLGYYTWAVQGATTDSVTIGRIHPGMTAATATRLLPRRQAPIRLPAPPQPIGARACRYYTDGNFPIGYASWRICFGAGVVVSVSDLR